jgi:hypothetical protein
LRWLKWLYGDDPPEGSFVLPLSLQRLRAQRKLETICEAAGVTLAAYRKWQKKRELKDAFTAINEAIATNKSVNGPGSWNNIRPDTKVRMVAWAKAATLATCCSRANIELPNYYQLLDKAERTGVKDALNRYLGTSVPLPPGPVHCGLVATNFFIPTPAMLAFRKRALQVRGSMPGGSSVARLPGYDEWLIDWTIPAARNGRRRALPLSAPASMASPPHAQDNDGGDTREPPLADPASDQQDFRSGSVTLGDFGEPVFVNGRPKSLDKPAHYKVVKALVLAGKRGLSKDELEHINAAARRTLAELRGDPDWERVIHMPGTKGNRYRIG